MSDELRKTDSTAVRAAGPLESPLLSFNLEAEINRLRGEEGWQAGRDSKTLVKHPDFRVVLTVLKSGARLHNHRAPGSISIHVLSGRIRMQIEDKVIELPASALLALERAMPHDVEALEDSAFLLTIAWAKEA